MMKKLTLIIFCALMTTVLSAQDLGETQLDKDSIFSKTKVYFKKGSKIVHLNYLDNSKQLNLIGNLLSDNPDLNLVIEGFSKDSASKIFNSLLAYYRSEETINWLVKNYKIHKERLILNYKIELAGIRGGQPIKLEERCVSFRIATEDEKSMAKPE